MYLFIYLFICVCIRLCKHTCNFVMCCLFQVHKLIFSLAAPLFYVKRIPEPEVRILGTVESVRQERSSPVTYAPPLEKTAIGSEVSIDPKENSEQNVEESKRDVSLEELLAADDNKKREKRINKDKKSVEKDSRIKTVVRSHKKSVHSRATGKQQYQAFIFKGSF